MLRTSSMTLYQVMDGQMDVWMDGWMDFFKQPLFYVRKYMQSYCTRKTLFQKNCLTVKILVYFRYQFCPCVNKNSSNPLMYGSQLIIKMYNYM